MANADAYVNLSDCGLNPDDVPDANFFNDPAPRNPGFAGQFGKDNVLYVRSPERPRFVFTTVTPLPGTLVTGASVALSVQVQVGASGTPLNPDERTRALRDHRARRAVAPRGAGGPAGPG